MSSRARRDSRTAAARRRARRRSFLAVFAVFVAVILIAAGLFALTSGGSDRDTEAAAVEGYPYPVEMFPPDPGGRQHFAQGVTYDNYNSNPPTSGPHTNVAAGPGVYDQPVPKEIAVHNMEHGHVVVWYNCSAGSQPLDEAACGSLIGQLAQIVNQANGDGKRVLMTQFGGINSRIALTAWQFLDEFDDLDQQRVQTFIDTFYCHTNLEGFC
jgi:hypothetical protein